jgi:hypothetical protein
LGLPYEYIRGEDNCGELEGVAGTIRDCDDYHVARIWEDGASISSDNPHERAEFLALAANSHDALVAALTKIYYDNEADCGCECNTETCCNHVGEPCSKCDARAALALVNKQEEGDEVALARVVQQASDQHHE